MAHSERSRTAAAEVVIAGNYCDMGKCMKHHEVIIDFRWCGMVELSRSSLMAQTDSES